MNEIKSAVEIGAGYYTGLTFQPDELAYVRSLIRAQWLDRIGAAHPEARPQFESIEMDRYHELAGLVDHKALWPKQRRILDPYAVAEIRKTSLIRALEAEFGHFDISDEDEVGHEEMYWRLVRPDSASDVGPMHADAWFWALGHGTTPPGMVRVKVWIAIYCDPGQNGFRFVGDSHKKEWPYRGDFRDGLVKPQIQVPDSDLAIQIFESQPGQAIVFNDRLLHGGAPGGRRTRVSLEFTMFVDRERYYH